MEDEPRAGRSRKGRLYLRPIPLLSSTSLVARVAYLESAARSLDYPNFKDAVGTRQGSMRARTYGKIWSVMYGLQKT